MQRAKDGGGGLGGPELGIEQALGGVIDHGDQRGANVGGETQPRMRAAVEMQQLAEAGSRLTPATVPTARAAFAHKTRFLQSEPDETVRERHAMIAADEPMEVADIPAAKLLAVEPQNALDFARRSLAPRRAQAASVIERHSAA